MIKTLFTVILFLSSYSAYSKEITPNEVYGVAQSVYDELIKIHRLEHISYSDKALKSSSKVGSQKMPRHVYEKAAHIFETIQRVRDRKGLALQSMPETPMQEVQPKDVKAILDTVLQGLLEIQSQYSEGSLKPSTQEYTNKAPLDVYHKLGEVERLVENLLYEEIKPKHVYKKAVLIEKNFAEILKQYKVAYTADKAHPSVPKAPADVRDSALKIPYLLKELCKLNEDICVPGGVPGALLDLEDSSFLTMPSDVLKVMNDLLADSKSLNKSLGLPVHSEMNVSEDKEIYPTDVYGVTLNIRHMLTDLIHHFEGQK